MLPFKSLISSHQLSPEVIRDIFAITDQMQSVIEQQGRVGILDDKVVTLLFFEPSSRTMLSFQAAAQRLKAGTVFAQNAASTSFEKGESIEDMIKVVAGYSDIIVMRHALPGSAKTAADISSVPFINAGDGGNEHPTQAIIDVYTIHRHRGRLDNLNIVFGYDSLQSRSIHSLSRLLAQYPGNKLTFVGPQALFPSRKMLDELEALGAQCDVQDCALPAHEIDIIYLNRLQEERFAEPALFEENRQKYRLRRQDVEHSDALILDPLPRIDEIATDVDDLPNAVYFKQTSYGVPVRMALLAALLGKA